MELLSQTNLILIVLIFLTFILLQIQIVFINKRRKQLFGHDVKDTEEILTKHGNEIKNLKEELEKLNTGLRASLGLGKKSIHRIGVVRFNPFSDTGGDQSFAIALLDANNNGIVISSIHAREGTRIYAKPIEKGESKYNLSEEEKKAIKKAQDTESTEKDTEKH